MIIKENYKISALILCHFLDFISLFLQKIFFNLIKNAITYIFQKKFIFEVTTN